MIWRAAWVLLVLLVLVPARAEVLVLGDATRYDLAPVFTWLEDDTRGLTLDDILQPAYQARFRPAPRTGPGTNFGSTRSAIWLRAELRAPPHADPDWLLEIAYPPLDRLELYAPDVLGAYQRQLAGDLLPFSRKPLAHRNHVLPVRVQGDATAVIYLRLTSDGAVTAPARLWRREALWEEDQRVYGLLSVYFGLLLGLFFYNLLLYLSVRDRTYLIYVLFVAGMGVVQASLTGLGLQYLWPRHPWWNSVSSPVGMSISAVFALLFARNFLDSRNLMPLMDRLILAMVGGWLLTLLVTLFLPYTWSAFMVSYLAVVGVVVLVASGIKAIVRGRAGARQYMAAWALLLLGVFTLYLHNAGFLPSNAFTSNALLIGSGLEMVLLSFALADRIKNALRQKDQANARLAAEQGMVQAMAESQRQLRTVLEEREIILASSIVGIAFLTPAGRFRWANKAMLDIFGASNTDNIDSIEPFYLTRDEYRSVGADVAAAVARGEVYVKELQMRRVDGVLIWVQLSGKAVSRHDLGQGTVWVIMDITRRKRLEEQLQASMAEREAALNNAVVGIVVSVHRRHEWVNEKFAQMLGYPREALIGQPSRYLHPDAESWERFDREVHESLAASGAYLCERQVVRRDGELLWVQMGGSCLQPNDPDAGVIWTFLDITERKKSETEIREALEQQKTLNELRSRFVAMTSHEFRTPLAAILSAEEVLRHYGDRLPPADRAETLDTIADGVQRMSRMLDRILLIGKADAGMLEFQPAPVDLPALCHHLVAEAQAQHPESPCEVVTAIDERVGKGCHDEKLLRHIFGNLLTNAIKYSPRGGTVHFAVQPSEDGTTRFEVRDEGIGIPADELDHLFQSFHRGSNVGAIPGTGLGLAIVKHAVEVHGGTIAVASEPGRGTRFTVRLPAGDPVRPH